MKTKVLPSVLTALAFALAVHPASVLAQWRPSARFTGLLNDYTPTGVGGGPWEMHGQWSMDLHGERDKADFLADMTMSDYVVFGGVVDTAQAGQNPHTHHIRLRDAQVTWDMAGCPTYSPATTTGFQISGPVDLITGNGGPALFETVPPTTKLHICVTGGTDVTFSNITMVFTGPATKHFGTQAIHGVVRKAEPLERDR